MLGQVREALALADAEGTAGPCSRASSSARSRPASARAARPAISAQQRVRRLRRREPRRRETLGGLDGRARARGRRRPARPSSRRSTCCRAGCAAVGREPHLPERLRAGRAPRRHGRALRGRRRAAPRRRRRRQLDLGAACGAAHRHGRARRARGARAAASCSTWPCRRDIEPGVGRLAGCRVHDARRPRGRIGPQRWRCAARRRVAAEEICADAAEEFRRWQAARTVVPAISAPARARRGPARRRGRAPRRPRLESTSRARAASSGSRARLVGKLLHEPTMRLRESASGPEACSSPRPCATCSASPTTRPTTP